MYLEIIERSYRAKKDTFNLSIVDSLKMCEAYGLILDAIDFNPINTKGHTGLAEFYAADCVGRLYFDYFGHVDKPFIANALFQLYKNIGGSINTYEPK